MKKMSSWTLNREQYGPFSYGDFFGVELSEIEVEKGYVSYQTVCDAFGIDESTEFAEIEDVSDALNLDLETDLNAGLNYEVSEENAKFLAAFSETVIYDGEKGRYVWHIPFMPVSLSLCSTNIVCDMSLEDLSWGEYFSIYEEWNDWKENHKITAIADAGEIEEFVKTNYPYYARYEVSLDALVNMIGCHEEASEESEESEEEREIEEYGRKMAEMRENANRYMEMELSLYQLEKDREYECRMKRGI